MCELDDNSPLRGVRDDVALPRQEDERFQAVNDG
jgi:hypothetical protein